MITNDLMIVTMGISFYLIPLLLLTATIVFMLRARRSPALQEDAAIKNIVRDPIIVTVVLIVGGFMMVSFLTGRLSLADYLSVPTEAFDVFWRSITQWEEPLSSSSIALRGGVLIAVVSVVVIAVTITSYFRTRLRGSARREP